MAKKRKGNQGKQTRLTKEELLVIMAQQNRTVK